MPSYWVGLLVKQEALQLQEVLVKLRARFFFIQLQELVATRLVRVHKGDAVWEVDLFHSRLLGRGDEKCRFYTGKSHLPNLKVISDDLKRRVDVHFE